MIGNRSIGHCSSFNEFIMIEISLFFFISQLHYFRYPIFRNYVISYCVPNLFHHNFSFSPRVELIFISKTRNNAKRFIFEWMRIELIQKKNRVSFFQNNNLSENAIFRLLIVYSLKCLFSVQNNKNSLFPFLHINSLVLLLTQWLLFCCFGCTTHSNKIPSMLHHPEWHFSAYGCFWLWCLSMSWICSVFSIVNSC